MNEGMDRTDFRAIVERLPLVVYVDALDERSTPIYVSSQIESLLGYTAAEWHADPDLYVRSLHADDRERMLAEIERRNHGEVTPTSHDYRLIARDGSIVWVRDEEAVVHDESGTPLHAAGYLQDVTERRHESMRLELLLGVLESATAGADPEEVTRSVVEHLGTRFSDVRVTFATISGASLEYLYSSDGDERALALHDSDLSGWYRDTMRRGESVVVSDTEADPRVDEPEWLRERGIAAYVDAPVRAGDELLGVLGFDSAEPRRWSPYEIRTFSEVADQLAVILSDAHARFERDRAERELLRRESILEAVSLIAAQLLGEPDWRTVAPALLERIGLAVGCSRAYLFENGTGPDGGVVTSRRFEWVAQGIEPQLENELMQEMSFAAVGLGRLERVVGSDRVFSSVVSLLPESERSLFAGQQIKSVLTVPIVVDGAWWGFIGFDDCVDERDWTATESEALRLAASLVAAAIRRRGADTKLRENEETLRAVFETSLDAVVVLDDRRHFVDVNPAASQLFGIATGASGRPGAGRVRPHRRARGAPAALGRAPRRRLRDREPLRAALGRRPQTDRGVDPPELPPRRAHPLPPRRHRADAARGRAPERAEAREHRPARRRGRARLQQPPHRDLRLRVSAPRAHARERRARARSRRDPSRGRARSRS